jgi:hypothetical protein
MDKRAVNYNSLANSYDAASVTEDELCKAGRKRHGVQGGHLDSLGLFPHASIPRIQLYGVF